ncbi:type ISP restriction/modification enzyme [Arsenicicoccus bolidensis]|uniref:type ISP restriction/modification enzyme n=1 Tax=Arsenicicoccus bolidensis TaxID=229480 RepID=UPI0004106E33|nr:type ISP restriction/modification enzyme [Arsenicicoccus bolidensis]
MSFADLVADYGKDAKRRLSGPGEREALLVTPITNLIERAGALVDLTVVTHNEVSELEGSVRPDFGVRVNGVLVGHIELKAPGTSLDPSTYGSTTHNYRQWQRLRELPNLLHTNGTEFRLWRYGELVDVPVNVHTGDLKTHVGALTAPGRLELIVNNFLQWQPTTIVSVAKLVDTLAPLARLLREEVLDAVKAERRAIKGGADPSTMPFTGISKDWRKLLFPQAKDEEFADGFSQTVVFALLLALSEDIEIASGNVFDIARALENKHTIMGRALNLLTEHVSGTPTWSAIEIIIRVLSATDWERLERKGESLYLHLYEDFLAQYDPEKRRKSGSYYTPVEVVDAMVGLTDRALRTHLGKPDGLRNPNVAIIDPAMGTGTYPLSVLRHVAAEAGKQYGPGAASEAVSSAVQRLYGIEIQSGPYSVAELRISAAIHEAGASHPSNGLNLFVADTLEDPYTASDQDLPYTAQLIARQRQQANKMKREKNIQVCIGNPPYKDHAGGMGGWIENGTDPNTNEHPLDAFKLEGNGGHERHLSNLYAYFWRWATWKVFESTHDPDITDGGNGIISFITATGYLVGPGFRGMREYLRKTCSNGWIINLTPEGKQPPQENAVFNIETPVAIGIFLRREDTDAATPADIKYLELHGRREEKFKQLAELTFDDPRWQATRSDWTAPFTPAPTDDWDSYPALDDLFPWRANGIMAGRGWVYAPHPATLEERFRELINETDETTRSDLFGEGKKEKGTRVRWAKAPLPGDDTEQNTTRPVTSITMVTDVKAVRTGFRVLDRQWVLADSRLLNRPSPTLWHGRIPGQMFAVELHSEHPRSGPGVVYTNLIPDVHHFRGSGGGRALPKLHPDGTPNTAPGLLEALSRHLGQKVSGGDLFDYVAGVAAHSGYLAQFDEQLRTPGIRTPITLDRDLWARACEHGRHMQWLHTFGEAGAHPDGYTDVRDPNLGGHPTYATPVGSTMPTEWRYDATTETLHVGAGTWTGLRAEAAEYTVGGSQVLESWLDFRLATPKKRYGSDLDHINAPQWFPEWSAELSNLLAILNQIAVLEEDMGELLGDILAGPLLSRDQLEDDDVQWPKGDRDPIRNPRLSLVGTLLEEPTSDEDQAGT